MNILTANNSESIQMANEIRKYISERCDKKELSLLKDKPDKKKGTGGINLRLELFAEKELGKANEQLKLIKKTKKEKEQSALDFHKDKYQKLLALLQGFKQDNRLIDIVHEYQQTLEGLKSEHDYSKWLNEWSGKARDISFATHVAKLTHSSSKSTSVYDKTQSINLAYLTTNTIRDLAVDTAVANAASSPAGEILTLKVKNMSLLDYIKANDSAPFAELSENLGEIETWMKNFKQAYEKENKNSHFLSKQVYFPVKNKKYHLFLPLVSSSMAHAIFLKLKYQFNEENELARKQKDKNKFYENYVVSYPKRASLKVPGKPQTASSLNGERGGRLTLFPSSPPRWTSKTRLPLKQKDLFNKKLSFQLKEEIFDLQRLLLIIKANEISMKKPEMHGAIVRNVLEIANGLFDQINNINLLSSEKGWTVNSDFPLHQQLLIEPGREDDAAVIEKNNKDWLNRIAEDFSAWLNRQLKHKLLNLTSIQQRFWQDIFFEELREYVAIKEVAQ